MSDSLFFGRRFRNINGVGDFNREVLAIDVGLNLPAPSGIRAFKRIIT
ncbi:hypothetical protein [Marinobacter sp. es.048]|nr:hypothetical protein [Marinobacter sp. es.048]